jgi:DNA mismatch endonuclease (patch repair protein)
MSRVKGKDTGLEVLLRSKLKEAGLNFVIYPKNLPGKPDIAFQEEKIAVFIDGDFWHGYRFPVWEHSLSPFWRDKIGKTRERDKRNFKKLRGMGWRVIRLWQHNIKKDIQSCMNKIVKAIESTNAI